MAAKTLTQEAEETAILTMQRLRGFAKEARLTDDQRKDAKIFHVTLTAAASLLQSLHSRTAFQMLLARQLTQEPEELNRYIRVTMPESALAQALPPLPTLPGPGSN